VKKHIMRNELSYVPGVTLGIAVVTLAQQTTMLVWGDL
jgi:hypothetical protein